MRPTYMCHNKTTSAKRTVPEYSIITSLFHLCTIFTIISNLCLFAHWSLSPPPLHPHAFSLPTSNLNCTKTSPFPSTTLDHPNPAIGPFHHLRPSPDTAAPIGDIRGPLSPTTSQGSFPHGQGVLGASSIYFHIYAYLKDHL